MEIEQTTYDLRKACNVKETDTRLGTMLRAYRAERNLSQRMLADEIGIQQSYLSKIELHGIGGLAETHVDKFMEWLLE